MEFRYFEKLVPDEDLYDEKTKTWLDKDGPPSNEEVYETYNDILVIKEDTQSEFVRVGFKHESPDIAAEWTTLVIKDLNDAIRRQDISEAESSISYLKQQVEASPLIDLRTLFYNLIQSQTETMMLANVREEYVFKTIDPATVPEFKQNQKDNYMPFWEFFSGGFIAFYLCSFRHYIRPINF